ICVLHPGECCNRHRTAARQPPKQGPFSLNGPASERMFQHANGLICLAVVGPGFDRERSLADGRNHYAWIDPLCNSLAKPEPHQSGRSQDDRIECPFIQFSQPGLDITAELREKKIRPQVPELRCTSETARPDSSIFRKLVQ